MKKLIRTLLLFATITTTAQVIVSVQVDPKMITAEKGLDYTISISDTAGVVEIGFMIEHYAKRNYFSYSVTAGVPIQLTTNLITTIGLEAGEIIRSKIPIYKERTGKRGYYFYGANAEFRYWLNNIGITARTNYKRRTDLTGIYGENAVKFRLSNYVGLAYKF